MNADAIIISEYKIYCLFIAFDTKLLAGSHGELTNIQWIPLPTLHIEMNTMTEAIFKQQIDFLLNGEAAIASLRDWTLQSTKTQFHDLNRVVHS